MGAGPHRTSVVAKTKISSSRGDSGGQVLYGHLGEGLLILKRQEKDTGEGVGVSEMMLGKGSFRLREEPKCKAWQQETLRSSGRPVRLRGINHRAEEALRQASYS